MWMRSFAQAWKRRSTECSTPRPIGSARRSATSGRPERVDTRAGSYERKLQTKAGEVNLKVPRLRSLPFETQIIERYRRRESSVEEALMEMYLAGVSVRRVEDITEALWGTRVSPSAVSELNQQLYERIGKLAQCAAVGEFAYVSLDGIWLKRSWGGEVKNVAVLVAIGVDEQGYRQVLGVMEGTKEDADSWRQFLPVPEATWTSRRTAGDQRQVPGPGRGVGGVLSRRRLAAMHGALVSQREFDGAPIAKRSGDGRCSRRSMLRRTARRPRRRLPTWWPSFRT